MVKYHPKTPLLHTIFDHFDRDWSWFEYGISLVLNTLDNQKGRGLDTHLAQTVHQKEGLDGPYLVATKAEKKRAEGSTHCTGGTDSEGLHPPGVSK